MSLTAATLAQTPHIVWAGTYGGPGGDSPEGLASSTGKGCFLLVNSDFGAPRYWDANLFLLDSLGDTLWNRSLDFVNVWGRDVAATADGGCVVLALALDSADQYDILIARFSATGDTMWTRRYGGPGYQRGNAICIDGIDNIIVVGENFTVDDGSNTLVMKLTATGDSLWTAIHDMGFFGWGDGAIAVSSLPDGDYLMAGSGGFVDDASVPYISRLDSDGQVRFVRHFWMINAVPASLAVYPDDGFAIAGQYYGEYFDFEGPWLLRGDASGDSLWSYVDSTTTGQYSEVALLPDGSLVTIGSGKLDTLSASLLTRFDHGGNMTMQYPYQHAGVQSSGHSMVIGDFAQDSSVVLMGRMGDSLGAPCSHCDVFADKLTSLPLALCGDIDGNGFGPNVSDLTYLVGYLFLSRPSPPFAVLADLDSSSQINISDLTYLVNFLFKGGPPPAC